MCASGHNRPLGRKTIIRPAKPLLLRDDALEMAAAARRPLVPTHVAGTTKHARQHVPRNKQS